MIPDGLEMVAGFVMGLAIGTIGGAAVMAMLAAASRADRSRPDLQGDAATELGRIGA